MDGNVNLVIALIDNSDNLLERIPDRHADKSGKLTYSVVNVNNEIAWLHLLKFLHRKCHLTGTSRLSTKIILMEALKNLVVGKETETKVIIHESLVKSL